MTDPQTHASAERVGWTEPTRADPSATAAEADRRERANFARGAEADDELSIARIAFLLGEHSRAHGEGELSRMLVREARSGRLATTQPLDRARSGADWVRRSAPASTPVSRDSFRFWVRAFGLPEWKTRTSLAAIWCRLHTAPAVTDRPFIASKEQA